MNAFSEQWEDRYRSNSHMSVWPWSDLVSYVHRHAGPMSPDYRVLELGSGAGANIPLFKHLGVRYFGIDGSATIVAALKARFPEYRDQIVQGDFVEALPFEAGFDLVVDRGSLTHNNTDSIRMCVRNVHAHLKPGGLFIGIDWFSTRHADYSKGKPAEDVNTRTDFLSGQFAGVGRVHFSDEAHVRDLLSPFRLIAMDHKLVETLVPINHVFASWLFAAQKTTERIPT